MKEHIQKILNTALLYSTYDSEGSDITVTQLIKPPQEVRISKEHKEEIQKAEAENPEDAIWKVFGSAFHHLLEQAANMDNENIAEKRFHVKRYGWDISGQVDLVRFSDTKALIDWKTTSVFKTMKALKGDCEDWIRQLNLLKILAEANGVDIDSLYIGAFSKDWRVSESQNRADYPKRVEIIEIPVIQNFDHVLDMMVKDHQQKKPRPCTDDERWYNGDKWAVMKKGRKSALRLLDTNDEAIQWCVKNGYANGDSMLESYIQIKSRPGIYRKCEQYCPAAPWCPQWKGDRNGN